ncbi:hypothetical protein AB1046_04490 [Promicromonospora sp. Populi]|uniref:hypothetical protein n=1 Tax=Promicromonospora sp. Populi TaxID=3239420 RepID=UPI0034E1B1DD
MQRHVGTALGTLVVAGLLSGCASGASTANFTAPEKYETVEQLVADADVVALVQAGASDVDVVDRVPYTRTELQVRKVLLGALSKDAGLAVTQVGSAAAPPGDGLPEVLQDGQQYVVVLHRTAAGEFTVVGPGVWRADGLGATLTLHTAVAACVSPAIPHLTTPWELEVELGEVGGALSTSAIGQTDATGTRSTGTHATATNTGGTDAAWHYSAWHDSAHTESAHTVG